MATLFTYAGILSWLFIQGVDLLQYSSEAQIYPQRADITVDAGTDLTLGCRGAEPMLWTFQDDYNGPNFNKSIKTITYMFNDKEIEYKNETILTVYNVSHVNIGYYHCHGAAADFNTPRRSSRIYVFVHDDNQLSVIASEKYEFLDTTFIMFVPCRPTAQDINITVTCQVSVGYNIAMSVHPSNYTAVQRSLLHVGTYNPYRGFEFRYDHFSPTTDHCSCNFARNNKTSGLKLVKIGSYGDGSDQFTEDSATADTGDEVTLQCAYIGGPFLPVHKYWLKWDVPAAGSKHTDILQVIKWKTLTIVTSSVTIKNISNEDEGKYTCRWENGWIVERSTYVYVNDKKSNTGAPKIYSSTKGEVQINAGANITLRCESPRPVTWTPNQVKKSYSIKHFLNGSRYKTYLYLTKASYRDVGFYHCHENSSSKNHPFHSDSIYIFVKDAQYLYVPQKKDHYIYPYRNVTVPCLPTSRDVHVSLSMLHSGPYWNSRLLPKLNITREHYAYDPQKGFVVQMPGPGDAIATCTFKTESATDTLDIQYTIHVPFDETEPVITGPHDDLVFVDQTLELFCAVFVHFNVPDDALRWTRPNNVTTSGLTKDIKIINYEDGKVLLSKLTLRDVQAADEGRYFCHSLHNNAATSKVITVYDAFSVNKPSIEYLQYNYAYVGQQLVLRCKVNVTHNIDIRMSWITPNGTEIQDPNIEYIPHIWNTSGEISLIIPNTTEENEGNYSCNVFYSKNSRNGATRHIIVKEIKKPRILKSNFKNKEEIGVQVQETVTLTCFAEGDPQPVITWIKNFTVVRRPDRHIGFAATNSELTVHYFEGPDAGLYTCVAKNPFGQDSRDVHLRLKTASLIPYIAATIFIFILCTVVSILLVMKSNKTKKLKKALIEAGFMNSSGDLIHFNPLLNIAEQATLLPYDAKWEIPRNNIELGRNLGSGYFGLVVEATVSNFFDGEPEKTVAVKMLHRHCYSVDLNSLICELQIMTHLGEHVNLIKLLGASADRITAGNLLVVIEYCEHGSLRNYLIENRSNFVNLIDPDTELICFPDEDTDSLQDAGASDNTTRLAELNTLQLLHWALQVAQGMEFLVSKQILHGDLALRNVLLAGTFVVKISDFGLSKTLSSSGYYKKSSQCPLPVKWMAIESIRDKMFSTQSDVWAFGVVLWELFSLARTPYAELEPDFRFYRLLEIGHRLQRPDYSTREIYQVMRECWNDRPQTRPTFSCLAQTLTDLLQDPNKRCSAEIDECVAASVLAAARADPAAPDWVALDILPSSSSAAGILETHL